MKVCLITSAAYIDTELAAEFGRLPPSFLPVGHQRLYELQIANVINSLGCAVYISLPKSFVIPLSDCALLDKQSVKIVFVPDGLSLAQSILFSLDSIPDFIDEIAILHGDTLIEDIPVCKGDLIAMSKAPESYDWGSLSPNRNVQALDSIDTKNLVMAGYFSFQDVNLLKEALSQQNLTFSECIAFYDAFRPLEHHSISSWLDFGHLQTFFRSRCYVGTQRAFNNLTINYQSITKTSSQTQKIKNEACWFESIPSKLRLYTPALLDIQSQNPASYSLEYLPYPTLHELFIFGRLKKENWDCILSSCFSFMELCTQFPYEGSSENLPLAYLLTQKSTSRLQSFLESSDHDVDDDWSYMGKTLPSLREML